MVALGMFEQLEDNRELPENWKDGSQWWEEHLRDAED
jgi:hypothetical protein